MPENSVAGLCDQTDRQSARHSLPKAQESWGKACVASSTHLPLPPIIYISPDFHRLLVIHYNLTQVATYKQSML
jgi:hypothetical protein